VGSNSAWLAVRSWPKPSTLSLKGILLGNIGKSIKLLDRDGTLERASSALHLGSVVCLETSLVGSVVNTTIRYMSTHEASPFPSSLLLVAVRATDG